MGDGFVVEAPGRRQPLVTLPRTGKSGDHVQPPVVSIDVSFGRRAAGCCICDIPIPPETTRVEIRVWLREPIVQKDGGKRLSEKYFAHPGCLTDRVRPEVIRSRMDCYDCGAIPEQREQHPYIYWHDRCFTVSKFAAAPICPACVKKPRWRQCQACSTYFPHWMVAEAAESKDAADLDVAHLGQYASLAIRPYEHVCEYCARRLNIPTVVQTAEAKADFDRLRAEIAAKGIFAAGEDD